MSEKLSGVGLVAQPGDLERSLIMYKKIAIGVIMATATLVVCLIPLKEVAYTATVDYRDTETYYESEPYQDAETYYETEPLTHKVVKSYTDTDSYKERRRIVIGGVVFQDDVVEVFFPIGCVTLQNTDSVYGIFRIQFTFYALDKFIAENFPGTKEELIKTFAEKYYREESLTLEPGETGMVRCSVQDIDIDEVAWEWKYTITEATKTVEKQRTVTKYRQVERQRIVTKQRPETHYKRVTLLEYLTAY